MKGRNNDNGRKRKVRSKAAEGHPADHPSNVRTFAEVLAEAEAVRDQVELSHAITRGGYTMLAWAPLLKPWMGWILRGERLRRLPW